MGVTTRAEINELAGHYAKACKGDKTRMILLALADGYDFKQVVGHMGDEGLSVAFNAIASGYIDRGVITEKGRVYLQKGSDA
jgi:hypothetical protein